MKPLVIGKLGAVPTDDEGQLWAEELTLLECHHDGLVMGTEVSVADIGWGEIERIIGPTADDVSIDFRWTEGYGKRRRQYSAVYPAETWLTDEEQDARAALSDDELTAWYEARQAAAEAQDEATRALYVAIRSAWEAWARRMVAEEVDG